MSLERLQKVIARAGVASRRHAEELILSGQVKVNGKVVTTLGTKVDPAKDHIRIGEKRLKLSQNLVYILLYKPPNCLSSLSDPLDRPLVMDLLPSLSERIYPVGRLDFDAEGLLLLTNDGDLTAHMIHPRSRIPRTYLVKVKGHPETSEIKALREGVKLNDGYTLPAEVKLEQELSRNSWWEITLYEGRNRQVKRMFEAIGYPVIRLKRIRFGPLWLGDMKSGEYMFLEKEEIRTLQKWLESKGKAKKSKSRKKKANIN